MRVLITGAQGFIGRNLLVHLQENKIESVSHTRDMTIEQLAVSLDTVDFVFHLAGVNRPKDAQEFAEGNHHFTEELCRLIKETGRKIPILYTSSVQAELDNQYGVSKLAAEKALEALADDANIPVFIYRLPNIFGKWSRPNYNSAVATFCYNIANDLPIQINDPAALIKLAYIDDVIADFMTRLAQDACQVHRPEISSVYTISVGELVNQIKAFKASRSSLITEPVGTGFVRALYSTYLSFLRPQDFSYAVPVHADPRGRFVEMLKTKDSGQFSFFTAHPGITRGGHYHHTKTEKFLVIQGRARFGFHHIVTGEICEIFTEGSSPQVVETVPGWSHDITNVGDNEMIVMLWANEIFDRDLPDTIAHRV
jgi:UDP-2-acetamido-2,6-beta-L-arabino-hexul-4-ose reductase